MSPTSPVRKSDIAGVARLVTDATTGITDLVEAMHARIARPPGFPAGAAAGRTSGITGFVYGAVRGVTRAVGVGVEALIDLAPAFGSDAPAPQRDALVAALNGVLGDHLVATGNPLAKPMELRHDGRALPDDPAELAARLPEAASGVIVFLHGLCMTEGQWVRAGRDRGAELAADLGLTTLRLDYNTGLHVSQNGAALAARLEALVDQWPRPLERIVLVGHSMGGLVARSAEIHAVEAGLRWRNLLTDMVFLGTPHHGAPLEKAGHWLDVVLGATPYAAPFARLGRVRSAGIADLRHGALHEDDRKGGAGVGVFADRRRPRPLPADVECWTIAAATAQADNRFADGVIGDGLVPLASALGQHRDPARALAFPTDHQRVVRGIGHLEPMWSDEVFEQMRAWLARPAAPSAVG